MGDKAYKDLHRLLGLCHNCSEKAILGTSRCPTHAISNHRIMANVYRKRLGENRCGRCGVPLDDDLDANFKECINCREHKQDVSHITLFKEVSYSSPQG
jgi:hypothetical protein